MKSICKLIYGYMAITYAMLFLGVLTSDTLYAEKSRIFCASSVPRKFVPEILNVPTVVPWLLFALMIVAAVVCGKLLKQFTLGIGIANGLLGLYTLIVYAPELKHFVPFTTDMPTTRSAIFVIGSYVIVLLSLVMVPMILLSKEDGEFDRLFEK